VAYIDRWANTTDKARKHLEELCKACEHVRYLHGDAKRPTMVYAAVTLIPGTCNTCKCRGFMDEAPLTNDDVLSLHDWLKDRDTMRELGV